MQRQTYLENLPEPDAIAQNCSIQLLDIIRNEIIASKRPMRFDRFMQLALYEPRYGYYMSGKTKFGLAGDFVTAPEVSSLFSYCLAEQCGEVLKMLKDGSILELGAGKGSMAADILYWLQQHNCLPECYFILELSGELKQQQYNTIVKRVPGYIERVHWISSLEDFNFRGVLLANEVLDAMPVRAFQLSEAAIVEELSVDWNANIDVLQFCTNDAEPTLMSAVKEIQDDIAYDLPASYRSEINLSLTPWFTTITNSIQQGLALFIDYGYPAAEYYAPDKCQGTLMCHYHHLAHSDPLRWVGLQDITAHVNFTAVAQAAQRSGLELAGFTDQASFLLSCGLQDILQYHVNRAPDDLKIRMELAQQVKTLTMPYAMGERFYAQAFTCDYDRPLLGFQNARDRRYRL